MSFSIVSNVDTFKKGGNLSLQRMNSLLLKQAKGATGSRPTSQPVGTMYFDTTLGKPIWFNGTAWVDASGTVV